MSGEPDPQYSAARRAPLDGLAALEPHLDSLVVIGAQAIYCHTGPADLAIAEFATEPISRSARSSSPPSPTSAS